MQIWHPLLNVKLKTSDKFIVECKYALDNKVKFGGLRGEDEMCVGMLAYYPKILLSRCMTAPERSGIIRINLPKPTKDQVYNDVQYYSALMYGVDWRYVGIRNKFQLLTLRNDAVVVCTNSKTGQIVLNRLVTQYHRIDKMYNETDKYVCVRPEVVTPRVVTVLVTGKNPSGSSAVKSVQGLVMCTLFLAMLQLY
ncbi:DBH-like monooxygenase protein 2 homolog [Tubulanus polymorphus]|uniref:DBH-like monooxygenase protein 2 homolog n=1 Tax=Tubulanus polymorphus TaxID=672921 RepID=UPI003DA38898